MDILLAAATGAAHHAVHQQHATHRWPDRSQHPVRKAPGGDRCHSGGRSAGSSILHGHRSSARSHCTHFVSIDRDLHGAHQPSVDWSRRAITRVDCIDGEDVHRVEEHWKVRTVSVELCASVTAYGLWVFQSSSWIHYCLGRKTRTQRLINSKSPINQCITMSE